MENWRRQLAMLPSSSNLPDPGIPPIYPGPSQDTYPLPPPNLNYKMSLELFLMVQDTKPLCRPFQNFPIEELVLKLFETIYGPKFHQGQTYVKYEDTTVVAYELYRRAGLVVTNPQIQEFFYKTKSRLKELITYAIETERLDRENLEIRLSCWSHYKYCRYLREATRSMEIELYERMKNAPAPEAPGSVETVQMVMPEVVQRSEKGGRGSSAIGYVEQPVTVTRLHLPNLFHDPHLPRIFPIADVSVPQRFVKPDPPIPGPPKIDHRTRSLQAADFEWGEVRAVCEKASSMSRRVTLQNALIAVLEEVEPKRGTRVKDAVLSVAEKHRK